MYTHMCTIDAKLDELCKNLQPQTSKNKVNEEPFYRIDFEIGLLFGLTEFRAFVAWKNKAVSLLYIPSLYFTNSSYKGKGTEVISIPSDLHCH